MGSAAALVTIGTGSRTGYCIDAFGRWVALYEVDGPAERGAVRFSR
jgi:hypothetical protein